MSRLQTGAITASLTDVGLARATRNALHPIEGSERIAVEIDPDLVHRADPGLLDRVLANICDNSLKYTPEEAAIRIDAAASNGRITLRIADSGPGVHDRDHDRLFAPSNDSVTSRNKAASDWDSPWPRASPRPWAAPSQPRTLPAAV
jgi:two-component system sensor histidine kinase KdpD